MIFTVPLIGFLFMLCWGARRYEDSGELCYGVVAAIGLGGLMMIGG